MSITLETAQAHANDPAVCCCRFEEGTIIAPENLEDPAIFGDLEDSGLLVIPENHLTVGQVLGAKLTKTLDALSPMTTDNVEGYKVAETDTEESAKEVEAPVAQVTPTQGATVQATTGQVIKIHIKEGKDINLEIPLTIAAQMGVVSQK